MNIELDQVVVVDVSDDLMELVAGVALGAGAAKYSFYHTSCCAF